MGATLFVLLVVVGLTSSASIPTTSNIITECTTDDECTYSQYCYETGVCAACYECGVYFRHPSTTGCAKTPQMCGPCIDGYMDEILSGGKARDTCTRTPTQAPEPVLKGLGSWNTPHMWFFAGFVGVGMAATVIIAIVRSIGKNGVHRFSWSAGNGSYRVYSVPSAPPLPSKDNHITRDWVEEPLFPDHERERIVNTRSVPFDTSNYTPKSGTCSAEHGGPSHTQFYTEHDAGWLNAAPPAEPPAAPPAVPPAPVAPLAQNAPELEDDATIPSTWTPETMSDETLVTSFTGLFSRTNNNNSSSTPNNNTSLVPLNTSAEEFSPSSSFNSTESSSFNDTSNSSSSSSNSSSNASSGGASSGPNTFPNVGGPLHILFQGGVGQNNVQCSVLVNNFQINEY